MFKPIGFLSPSHVRPRLTVLRQQPLSLPRVERDPRGLGFELAEILLKDQFFPAVKVDEDIFVPDDLLDDAPRPLLKPHIVLRIKHEILGDSHDTAHLEVLEAAVQRDAGVCAVVALPQRDAGDLLFLRKHPVPSVHRPSKKSPSNGIPV
eukprot:gene13336-biopygen6110